ncbi:uncharacterized protein LOC6617679 [Drosophila sechellia]|uniref:GM26667 n=1 Tax=Drosophila sechellia TaxID=7238 RepID=B4IE32_DROSE|nr:uncharacterized protein LOC6617679 [Drosophila sechellia]EDW45859.1 GM26667 [Drosophila sechellia]
MLTTMRGSAKKLANWPLTHFRRFPTLIKSYASPEEKFEQKAEEVDGVSNMKLPYFISPKCVQNQDQLVDGQTKMFTYNYHPFSIYDLNEATLRAKQSADEYSKRIDELQKRKIEYVSK